MGWLYRYTSREGRRLKHEINELRGTLPELDQQITHAREPIREARKLWAQAVLASEMSTKLIKDKNFLPNPNFYVTEKGDYIVYKSGLKIKIPSIMMLTYNSEGSNDPNSRYFTRRAHWPGGASGLTYGKGYDMGYKHWSTIKNDLLRVGLQPEEVAEFYGAQGLKKRAAKRFLQLHQKDLAVMTEEQETQLFQITWKREEREALRIYNGIRKKEIVENKSKSKEQRVKVYPEQKNLHPAIWRFIVDCKYRGDYNSRSRKIISSAVRDNDPQALLKILKTHAYWKNVPEQRHQNRLYWLANDIKNSQSKL